MMWRGKVWWDKNDQPVEGTDASQTSLRVTRDDGRAEVVPAWVVDPEREDLRMQTRVGRVKLVL
jgi:hypothetical protein